MNQELESTTLSINSSNETEQIKQKRKRRTKAEMEESRKQEIIKDNKKIDSEEIGTEENNISVKRTGKYVYVEKVIKALEVAFETKKNILLYGPGGFSKSTLTIDFLLDKGIEPFVLTLGKGMTIDRLFGGLNLKKFQEEGKIEYLVENSFMNYEYVIFEEMFDAPDYILEQLKDVLSSKVLRNGTQFFPLKTKFIIANTNHTRTEYSKSNRSLLALMERFPLEIEVQWLNYNEITYSNLLNSVKGTVNPMLTYVLDEFAKSGNIISPRIALEAADVLDKCGPECFEFIADFASKPEILKKALTKFKAVEKIVTFEKIVKEYDEYMKPLVLDELVGKEIKSILDYHDSYKKALEKLKKITVDDSLSNRKTQLLKYAEDIFKIHSKKIDEYSINKTEVKDEKTGEIVTSEEKIDDLLRDISI